MLDTHAHLNFTDFSKDFNEILAQCAKDGISVINVGTNYLTSKKAVEIAEKHEGVYAAIGLHPLNISYVESGAKVCGHSTAPILEKPEDFLECEFDYELYKNLAKSKKAVAVGEIGLDYYKPKNDILFETFKFKQLDILSGQVKFAQDLGLPLILHVRKAHEDLIAYLQKEAAEGHKFTGVIHCFTGNQEQAGKYLDLGFMIGLNGIIFKMNLDKTIKALPLDRIVLETDCPFLSPVPDVKRNEPRYVLNVAERVAQIRGEEVEAIAAATSDNAKKLFKI